MKQILRAFVVMAFYVAVSPLCIFALISAVFEVCIEFGEEKILRPLLESLED